MSIKKISLTRHADASESPGIVQTGSVVVTRMRLALVDVCLASGTGESLRAIARKTTRSVDANSVVLARRS